MPSAALSAVAAQTLPASGGRLPDLSPPGLAAGAPPSAGVAVSACAGSPTCGSAIKLSVPRPSRQGAYGKFAVMFTVS